MFSDAGLTVTIHWLTLDGNRQAVGQCLGGGPNPGEQAVADLDVASAAVATVQWMNFIGAPWRGLQLGGTQGDSGQPSTLSYSNFGQGFNVPARGYSRTAPETATRWTSVWMFGDQTGVWHTNIAYSGTGAVGVWNGYRSVIAGNILNFNRYEMSDGISGGQVYIPDNSPAPSGGYCSAIFGTTDPCYALVADNSINGNYWSTTKYVPGTTDILCSPGASHQYPLGIEGSGNGHGYYNNSVIQNYGHGILLRPWSPTNPLNNNIISGYDPYCTGSCVQQNNYVSNDAACWTDNAENGYCFRSPFSPAMEASNVNVNSTVAGPGGGTGSASNLTLDHLRESDGFSWGVALYDITGTPGFTDSKNGGNYACITGNPLGKDLDAQSDASGYTSFTLLCP